MRIGHAAMDALSAPRAHFMVAESGCYNTERRFARFAKAEVLKGFVKTSGSDGMTNRMKRTVSGSACASGGETARQPPAASGPK